MGEPSIEELFTAYHKNKTIKLRNQIVERHMGLVANVVGWLKLPHDWGFDDARSVGYIGLMNAVETWKPKKGSKFDSWAMMKVRGYILDAIRYDSWVPRVEVARLKKSGEKPVKMLSINTVISKGTDGRVDELTFENIAYCPQAARDEHYYRFQETVQFLASRLSKFRPTYSKAFVRYYGESMDMEETGKQMRLSESRVSQLLSQSVKILRADTYAQKYYYAAYVK
jgi:RNA polymerase sigma factor for flagellar operon FliA